MASTLHHPPGGKAARVCGIGGAFGGGPVRGSGISGPACESERQGWMWRRPAGFRGNRPGDTMPSLPRRKWPRHVWLGGRYEGCSMRTSLPPSIEGDWSRTHPFILPVEVSQDPHHSGRGSYASGNSRRSGIRGPGRVVGVATGDELTAAAPFPQRRTSWGEGSCDASHPPPRAWIKDTLATIRRVRRSTAVR